MQHSSQTKSFRPWCKFLDEGVSLDAFVDTRLNVANFLNNSIDMCFQYLMF